ncbi:MAG: tetratricopeptide repeat protein [Candidatus Omnitrophica bacterium]|nr:tetratricopeptide repeat protein [Candidatus Omnitrophota bacterium]MDD5352878.1 tetratricopeptide repeat protein [Candidatus Omnitrophota bacterium]MDD5550477.1 tetratricopeptide repeat protein [Candidatus Omnitrophota bacterium]
MLPLFSDFAEAANISQDSRSYQNYIQGLLSDVSGEYQDAKRAYKKAVESDTGAWDAHYRLALDYIRLKDFKNATKELQSALKLKPYDEESRFLLACIYAYSSQPDEAIKECRKLLERPLLILNESDVRYSLVQLYVTKKDWVNAEVECKAILKNNPNDSNTHFYLGFIYSEFSTKEMAVSELRKALEINPDNVLALNSLSYVYAEQGENLDDALSLAQKALEIDPSNGSFLDTMGWVYFKRGDLNNALKYLESASALSNDAEVFDHLGEVYYKMGKNKEAVKSWQKSLAIEPGKKQIQEKIKTLNKK